MSEGEAGKGSPSGARTDVGAVAILLAGSIALSRVIGYVREAALANQLGVTPEADAYRAAFQLPDVMNYLLAGGALSIAFVPLYRRILDRQGEDAAARLFATVLGTVGALVAVGSALAWLYAEAFVAAVFPDFDAETQATTVRLTRIVLPAQFFFFTGGVVRAVLMARGRFGAHALAPLVYNVAIIAGGVATGSAEGFAWGVLIGAFVGPFLIPVLDARRFEPLRPRIAPLSPEFRRYLVLALPLMLGIGLTTVDEFYEKYFAAQLGAGTIALLGYARILMIAPVGMIGQAFSVAVLPALAQLSSRSESAEFDRVLLRTLRHSLALALLASAGLFVFGSPVVELLYHHGAFSDDHVARTSALLAVFSFAIPGFVLQQVAVRGFFAREEMWRPMLLNSLVALAAFLLYPALAERYHAEGIAAAAGIALTVNACVTLAWLRTRHGGPALGPLAATGLRTLPVALAAATAATALLGLGVGPGGRLGAVVDLMLGGAAFAAAGWLGVLVVGDDALRTVTERVLGLARRVIGGAQPRRRNGSA